jgi:DNA repair exonuclease SbcCD ATPase subunit
MAAEFDASEFIDDDFQTARKVAGVAEGSRAPSREEVDAKVTDMHQKLAELKRTQQELERERASLEDVRRRQVEFTTGREEMVQNLTRGVGILEEAEFATRRDAEQMAKALTDLREALEKVRALHEEDWSRDNLNVELTRALTTVENARMEWNSARLKFEILNGSRADETGGEQAPATLADALRERSYAEWCKLGIALTWPLALAALGIFVVLLVFLLRLR